MDLSLESRSALVLGSTSGLGLAIGQRLAEEGARVAFTGRRGAEAARLAESHPGAIGVELDLRDESSVDRAVSVVAERFGAVDILVLNSGGPPPGTAATLAAHDLA
ncbi:MAG: SDR family NAD(P)-dependent oxidoreductase, partial [Actinomadura sp.]